MKNQGKQIKKNIGKTVPVQEEAPNLRRLAADVLLKIERSGQYSNLSLDAAIRHSKLSDTDRGLLTAIVYGVTERRITLDYYIGQLSQRPSDGIDDETRTALRIGLYQLMYLDRVPDHAAVFESVEVAPQKSRGFVNAILRNYTRRKDTLKLPDENSTDGLYLSVKYSVPAPLCRKFTEIFGREKAENILNRLSEPAEVSLRVNTLKTDAAALTELLASHGITTNMSDTVPDTLVSTGFPVKGCTELDHGLFFIQDTASVICVGAAGAKLGDTVIDACACPGSKSFGLAISMNNTGKILACDLHNNKLSLVRSGAERLGIGNITTYARDAREFNPEWDSTADVVLCDVPCSGYGVIAKKPEIRYRELSSVASLPDIQLSILENCSRYVKHGGTLVYSTCTLLPEENQNNIEKFLCSHKEFTLTPFGFGQVSSPSGMLTLTPDMYGTDGFFIARMTRV